MKTIILGLFGVSLASALAEMLLIGKEGQGVKHSLRLITSLAVLLVVISPLMQSLKGEYQIPLDGLGGESTAALQEKYQAVFAGAVAEGSEALLAEGISDFLTTEFGIDKAHATVHTEFGTDGSLQAVFIKLSGSALLKNPDEIGKALAQKLSCKVEVR